MARKRVTLSGWNQFFQQRWIQHGGHACIFEGQNPVEGWDRLSICLVLSHPLLSPPSFSGLQYFWELFLETPWLFRTTEVVNLILPCQYLIVGNPKLYPVSIDVGGKHQPAQINLVSLLFHRINMYYRNLCCSEPKSSKISVYCC